MLSKSVEKILYVAFPLCCALDVIFTYVLSDSKAHIINKETNEVLKWFVVNDISPIAVILLTATVAFILIQCAFYIHNRLINRIGLGSYELFVILITVECIIRPLCGTTWYFRHNVGYIVSLITILDTCSVILLLNGLLFVLEITLSKLLRNGDVAERFNNTV